MTYGDAETNHNMQDGAVANSNAAALDLIRQLDADEAALWRARCDGIPQTRIAAVMGWTQARAARVCRRLNRKLRALRGHQRLEPPIRSKPTSELVGSSIASAFQQRLPSGRRVWSLSSSFYSQCPNLPIYVGPFSEEPMFTIAIDLQERLTKAQARLYELVRDREQHDKRVAELRGMLADAESAEREEREVALIAGHEPSAKILAKPATLTTALHGALSQFHTASGATARQARIVESLQSEINASARMRALTAAQPQLERFARLTDELSELSLEITGALRGYDYQASELFAGIDEHPSALGHRQALIGAMIAFLRSRSRFDPSLRRKLGWESEAA